MRFFRSVIAGSRSLRRSAAITSYSLPNPPPLPLNPSSIVPNPEFCVPSVAALSNLNSLRFYGGESKSAASGAVDVNKVVDEINLKFSEAREEIEMALESKETVYFNEEAEAAREAVKEVLNMFDGLMDKVGEEERGVIRRSMGLKIEQLKAELDQLNE